MADDFQDKTEEPTPKKLADARKKGQVAKSQDLTAALVLLASMGILLVASPFMYGILSNITVAIFTHLTENFESIEAVAYWARVGIWYLFLMASPMLFGLLLTGFFANVAQFNFLFSTEPLKPKWKNINVFDPSLYKKFFNLQAIMKLIFGLSKLAVVGGICYLVIYNALEEAGRLIFEEVGAIFIFITWHSFVMGIIIAIILLFLGVAEFVYQKWKFTQDMKMTKHEVKEERKQMEGDVHLKSKMRSMMQAMTQSRMKANVPHADVIIANPVHYAIALKYDEETMPAPICIAKGARKIALSIREIAENNGVPIVENPPLAQGLYRVVEIGDIVPAEFYHSVAEVLAYVYRLNATLETQKSVEKESHISGLRQP